MITEEQKYDSSILKSVGFAFLVPFGSIIFQNIVFKKALTDGDLLKGIIICIVGALLIYLGRCALKDNSDE